jgi:hypothetical protein
MRRRGARKRWANKQRVRETTTMLALTHYKSQVAQVQHIHSILGPSLDYLCHTCFRHASRQCRCDKLIIKILSNKYVCW